MLGSGTYAAGSSASEAFFKAQASSFDILHLTTHGVIDRDNRHNVYLLFKTEQDVANDGRLYPFELYNMRLKARLAVLSACNTGTGKNEKGEGVYSMARGFFLCWCPIGRNELMAYFWASLGLRLWNTFILTLVKVPRLMLVFDMPNFNT